MATTDYDSLASAILEGRLYADAVSIETESETGLPLNLMAMAHVMRSHLQNRIVMGEVAGYTLVPDYSSFGRIQVIRSTDQQQTLLKARAALSFETSQDSLFDGSELPSGSRPLELLLYKFTIDGLVLASVDVVRIPSGGRRRYALQGQVSDIGVWDGAGRLPSFDQGSDDRFVDISPDIQIVGEDE